MPSVAGALGGLVKRVGHGDAAATQLDRRIADVRDRIEQARRDVAALDGACEDPS